MLSKSQAHQHRGFHYLLLAVLMTAVVQLGHQMGWGRTDFVDNFALDRFFQLRGAYSPDDVAQKLPQSRRLLLIELPHSVPRPLLARLVRKLKRADLVALDMMLVNEASEINERESAFYQPSIAKWRKDTNVLASAIKDADNVMVGAWPEKVLVEDTLHPGSTFLKTIWQQPDAAIWRSAKYHAHLRLKISDDGITRAVTPFDGPAEHPLPALSVAAAAVGNQTPLNKISLQNNQLILGQKKIFLHDDALLIDYLGERNCFESNTNRILYDLVLNGQCDYDPVEKIDPLKGALVFVGQTQEKTKDTFATPFGDMPGVHANMHATATLLSDSGPPLPLFQWQTFFVALFSSLALTASLLRWPLGGCFCVLLLLIIGTCVADSLLFTKAHLYFPLSAPLATLVLTYNAIALYEYQRAHSALARVVGKKMAKAMMNPLRPMGLGGHVEEATAFFCDLRCYSLASERLSPELLSPLVFNYTNTVTTIVQRYGGRPIDYFGDGIFVLFEGNNTQGKAMTLGHHALRAMKAALEVQKGVEKQLLFWQKTDALPLYMAIGINTGPMLIGVVGSEDLMKLGAIGDAVNVAARVQGLTEQCKSSILITQESYNAVKSVLQDHGISVEKGGTFTVHNRNEPVTVFGLKTLRGADSTSEALLTESISVKMPMSV